jgi:4,5:9,10-diseco-3-hydroxy-5,9,17-trioxoandrosta-1(10),2-diene-4-oate hydrolase
MPSQISNDYYIQVGNIKTRYWQEGEKGPSVVLIHGLGGFMENWAFNINALSKNHRVLALDLVGCGLTGKPPDPYSIPYLANFVQDFLKLKNIEKANIIGHSLGAGIAIDLYLCNPSIVNKLILISGLGFGRKTAFELRLFSIPIIGEKLMEPNRKGLKQYLEMLFFKHELITDEMIDFYYEKTTLPGASRAYLSTLRSSTNFFGMKQNIIQMTKKNASKIKAPTLILWGNEDKVFPVQQAKKAEKMLPFVELHIFEECGHMVQIECAEELNDLVQKFMQ